MKRDIFEEFLEEFGEPDIFEQHADLIAPTIDINVVVECLPQDADDPEYQRGFMAGAGFCCCDNTTITKEDALEVAQGFKCEAFKRGFGDGYRHAGSCNGDIIPGEDAECDDAAAIWIRRLEAMRGAQS